VGRQLVASRNLCSGIQLSLVRLGLVVQQECVGEFIEPLGQVVALPLVLAVVELTVGEVVVQLAWVFVVACLGSCSGLGSSGCFLVVSCLVHLG
jgi:hypothetical protein